MDQPKLEKMRPVAAALGLSPGKLYRLAADGQIPFYRCGRALRFNRAELLAWMKREATQDRVTE